MSPDSSSLVSAGNNWIMRRWHFDGFTTGANPHRIPTGAKGIREIEVSPGGDWMACACEGDPTTLSHSADGWVSVGRVDGEKAVPLRALGHVATGVAFSPDCKWLAAAGSQQVCVWNFPAVAAAIEAGKTPPEPVLNFSLRELPERYDMRLTWLPDSRLYLVHGGGGALVWDSNQPAPANTLLGVRIHSILYFLPDVAVSPDGRLKAIARHGWDAPAEGKVQYGNQVLHFEGAWDGKFLEALPAHFKHRTDLAFSPDGRWLAGGGEGLPACLWDLRAPDIAASRRDFPEPELLSAAVAFSPDSRRLAAGTGDGEIHLWDWQNPDRAANLTTLQSPHPVRSIVWLRDGRLLTGGRGPAVSLWETDPAKLIAMARRTAGRQFSASEKQRFGLQK